MWHCHVLPSQSEFLEPKDTQATESPVAVLNESDETILLALSEKPFAWVRQLARRIHLHSSAVYDHLTHKFGSTARYLCWVPYLLSESDKHTRAQLSFELFEML
jgi:hypothetical protein